LYRCCRDGRRDSPEIIFYNFVKPGTCSILPAVFGWYGGFFLVLAFPATGWQYRNEVLEKSKI
jgi:hypothetical protein